MGSTAVSATGNHGNSEKGEWPGLGVMGSGNRAGVRRRQDVSRGRAVGRRWCGTGMKGIEKNLAGGGKGNDSESVKGEIRDRLGEGDYAVRIEEMHLVIEAIIEQLPAKEILSARSHRTCPRTRFCENIRSLTITEDCDLRQTAERFCGAAFFQSGAGDEIGEGADRLRRSGGYDEMWHSARSGGRQNPWGGGGGCAPDSTGFIVNAMLVPIA